MILAVLTSVPGLRCQLKKSLAAFFRTTCLNIKLVGNAQSILDYFSREIHLFALAVSPASTIPATISRDRFWGDAFSDYHFLRFSSARSLAEGIIPDYLRFRPVRADEGF